LTYLAMIPVSAYRYLAEERKATQAAKAQNGKGRSDHAKGQEPPAAERSVRAKP
jgi:hypothetical protein